MTDFTLVWRNEAQLIGILWGGGLGLLCLAWIYVAWHISHTKGSLMYVENTDLEKSVWRIGCYYILLLSKHNTKLDFRQSLKIVAL